MFLCIKLRKIWFVTRRLNFMQKKTNIFREWLYSLTSSEFSFELMLIGLSKRVAEMCTTNGKNRRWINLMFGLLVSQIKWHITCQSKKNCSFILFLHTIQYHHYKVRVLGKRHAITIYKSFSIIFQLNWWSIIDLRSIKMISLIELA